MMLSSIFSISRLFQAVREKYISPWLLYLRMRVPFFAFIAPAIKDLNITEHIVPSDV
jgi:hypothetical protein